MSERGLNLQLRLLRTFPLLAIRTICNSDTPSERHGAYLGSKADTSGEFPSAPMYLTAPPSHS
jgi:hypothetical protein